MSQGVTWAPIQFTRIQGLSCQHRVVWEWRETGIDEGVEDVAARVFDECL